MLKASANWQRVQKEQQQKNEDAMKSPQTLEKQQASPVPNIISQNKEEPAKKTHYQTRSVTQEAIMSIMDMSDAFMKLTARNICSRGFPIQFLVEYMNAVLDGETGELLEYWQLIQRPKYKDV